MEPPKAMQPSTVPMIIVVVAAHSKAFEPLPVCGLAFSHLENAICRAGVGRDCISQMLLGSGAGPDGVLRMVDYLRVTALVRQQSSILLHTPTKRRACHFGCDEV